MTPPTRKIAYLDGIRGIAAFLVFLHHFLLVFYIAYYDWNPNSVHLHGLEITYGQSVFSFISNGRFYVNIFFVLSGYVLSRKYFQTLKPDMLISGAQRRFVRIFVPVAFTLVLAYLLIKAGLFSNVPVSSITHSESWFGRMWTFPNPFRRLLQSLAYGTMFMGDGSLDTTLWTMSVEYYGSLFVFAFLALTHGTRNRRTMLLLTLLWCMVANQQRLAPFVLGMTLNYFENGRPVTSIAVSLIAAPLLLIIALILGSYPPNDPVSGAFFYRFPAVPLADTAWFHIIGGFLLILSFILSDAMQKIIGLRPFRFLGYISFSLYLLHPLVLGSFSSFLFLKLVSRLSYNYSVVVVFISTAVVCILVSWLMAKFVDANGIKLADRLYRRFVEAPADKRATSDRL